jgi:hypothetical protein
MLAENLEEVCRDEVFLGQPAARVKHEIVELLWVTVIYILDLVATYR